MKYLLSAALLVLIVASCKKSNNTAPGKIDITPSVTLADSTYVLNCATEASYVCGSNIILSTTERKGNNFTFRFTNVTTEGSCTNRPAPAHCQLDMAQLQPGTYTLTIYNGGQPSIVTLTVTPQSYTLAFDTLNNIKFTQLSVLRIPSLTMWGDVMYDDPFQSAMADTFIQKLTTFAPATPFTGQPGDYGYFALNTDGTLATVSDLAHIKTFIYHYAFTITTIDSIESMINRFGQAHSGAEFHVNLSNGDFFRFPEIEVTPL